MRRVSKLNVMADCFGATVCIVVRIVNLQSRFTYHFERDDQFAGLWRC